MGRPQYVAPAHQTAHVACCYRDIREDGNNYSHVGLGINCLHTAKCLRAALIQCDVFPVKTATDIANVITTIPTITHVVIDAPFIDTTSLTNLVHRFANIEFTCRAHSQVAFLTVEAGAIALIRQYIRLQDQTLNFRVSVNSDRLGTFLQEVYAGQILLLPNLYFINVVQHRLWHSPSKVLKVGSFGAIRIQKNHIVAAAASLMIAAVHKKDLEFYMSVSRVEHGKGVLNSIQNLFTGVSFATLVEVPWTNWSDFLRIISNVDLHMQMSTTETFNLTTADAAVQQIPTVSSSALDWVPKSWIAEIDNPSDIARVGWNLLSDAHAGPDGLAALQAYNSASLGKWKTWLNGDSHTMTNYHLTR